MRAKHDARTDIQCEAYVIAVESLMCCVIVVCFNIVCSSYSALSAARAAADSILGRVCVQSIL